MSKPQPKPQIYEIRKSRIPVPASAQIASANKDLRNYPPDDLYRPEPPPTDFRSRHEMQDTQVNALTLAIGRVLTPVMLCMMLAIWLVHSLGDPQDCRRLGIGRTLPEIQLEGGSDVNVEGGSVQVYSAATAGIFIGIFILLMIVFTFFLVFLYKTGKTGFIKGWLFTAVAMIFAYVGGVYIFDFCRSRCLNLDWVSLVIAVWNFTVGGLIAVFGVAPKIVNQAFLIVMSALMAYIFRTLPGWSTWTILAALVVWDLFAVLHKWGPLNQLVKLARSRNDSLPALVYDTDPNTTGRDNRKVRNWGDKSESKKKSKSRAASSTPPSQHMESNSTAEASALTQSARTNPSSQTDQDTLIPEKGHGEDSGLLQNGTAKSEEGVGTLGTHLKLGLGDFVFYSILVAQASREGAMATVAAFVAILAGLAVTLFLVTVYKKALPALPISICAGLMATFLTRYAVQPLIEHLIQELIFY